MPIDLADIDPRIVVRDQHGTEAPFSRGVMATSLLATGVLTDEAYRLASLVQARLLHHERHNIAVLDLVELTRLTLDEHAPDSNVARRWTAWRRSVQSGRPMVIALGGAPGVGKSIFATRLAVRLGITEVLSTDAVHEVLRLVVPPFVMPELHRPVSDLVEESFAGFERQSEGIASAAAAVVAGFVEDGRSVIVEGVHLLSGAITAHLANSARSPVVVERVITIAEANEHGEHVIDEAVHDLERLTTIRSIQLHLMARAHQAGVTCLDDRNTADLAQDVVDEIISKGTS